MRKTLRPYQIKAAEESSRYLEKGIWKQLLVLPTGTGKSLSAINIIEKYQKVLWITHVEELINQSAIAYLKDRFDFDVMSYVGMGVIEFLNQSDKQGIFNHGNTNEILKEIGVIKAERFDTEARVIFASAQTLHRRLDKLSHDMFDCIVCDEAHLFLSKTFQKSLDHFKPDLRLGLTATPFRTDGMLVGNIFDQIIYQYEILDAIQDGYLCELDAIRIKTDVNIDSVRTTAGELNAKDLQVVNCEERNNLVVEKYLKYAKGIQGLVFCVDVQHCIDMAKTFKEAGINAEFVVGDEELTTDRKGIVDSFKKGKIDVLINCNLLTTGFDHPNVGCVMMARPTKSKTLYLQALGRGTRLKTPDFVKAFGQKCIILDFVDATTRHRLINTYSLDQEKPLAERVYMTKEKKDDLIKKKREMEVSKQKHDEKVDLFQLPKGVVSNSIKMEESATENQLKWIADEGYDIENTVYTKAMCAEIINSLPCTSKQIGYLKWKKYDVSKGVTRGEFASAMKEIEKREEKERMKVVIKNSPLTDIN